MAKQHRGWGGPRAGRPLGSRKLTPARREAVVRDYVTRMDAAKLHHWQRPYRDEIIDTLVDIYEISRRMVVSCLTEVGVRRIHAENKKFLKSERAKRNLRFLQREKRKFQKAQKFRLKKFKT